MKVLIIEAEKGIIDPLTTRLQSVGCTVWSSNTIGHGRTLINSVGENTDVFIIDANLPDGDGVNLAIETKNIYRNCLVIIMSGGLEQNRITEVTKLGIIFLSKPFLWPEFKKILCL